MANFTPNQKEYKNMTPFKLAVLKYFPYINTADFDSLTNYGIMCKLGEHLNTIQDNEKFTEENVTNLFNAYNALQNYVNNYFDNLDVQDEINNKLDKMAEDGSLDKLLKPYFDSLTQQINELDGAIKQEKSDRETKDLSLQNQINNIVTGAGSSEASSAEILQARTNINGQNFDTLNGRISYIESTVPFKWQVLTNADLNNILLPGKYMLITPSANAPFSTGLMYMELIEYSIDNKINTDSFPWLIQKVYRRQTANDKSGFSYRIIQRTGKSGNYSYTYSNWGNIVPEDITAIQNELKKKINRLKLSDYYNSGLLLNDEDFNTVVKEGNYIVVKSNGANNPLKSSGILRVDANYLGQNYGNNWVVQTFQDIQTNKIMIRSINYSVPSPETSTYYPWKQIYPLPSEALLVNKTVVNFGDSIFGNFNDNTSISSYMSDILGANCINVGFGGCQMSNRPDHNTWEPFSMCKLADAVASKDFSFQEAAINNTDWKDQPGYFKDHLETLKSIDFTKVDYITIAYGTNDYTAGDKLDNNDNKLDISTVLGALRYSIETILKAYPNLRILIGTPIWRCWLNSDKTEVLEDSNTKTFAGNYTLKELAENIIEVGKEYQIPVLDCYNNLCLNKFNWSSYFSANDTTHPIARGRYNIAKEYSYKLLSI